jgi:hypothetical protein
VSDGRDIPVEGRAEHSSCTRKRKNKKKREDYRKRQQSMRGSEVTASDGYAESVQDQAQDTEARLDDIRRPPSNAFDANCSERPRIKVPDPPRQNGTWARAKEARKQRRVDDLERARQLAPSYPDLGDIEAWRKLGQNTKHGSQEEHTFVFWHLRLDQRPRGLGFGEWKKRVHQEMEQLGLRAKKAPEGGVEGIVMEGVPQESIETAEDEQRRRDMERMVADDGLDIDIYGDEETREKYEPWIRSRMDRT